MLGDTLSVFNLQHDDLARVAWYILEPGEGAPDDEDGESSESDAPATESR